MKFQFLILIAFFHVLGFSQTGQKINEDQLYKVTIFKWVKNEKGEEHKKFILIDQTGNIEFNGGNSNSITNIKYFTKSINKFIIEEKIKKIDANNNPPKRAPIPNHNEQYINISIIKLEDFDKEKNYMNKSEYSWKLITTSAMKDYVFYKYLKSDDLELLKKLLE